MSSLCHLKGAILAFEACSVRRLELLSDCWQNSLVLKWCSLVDGSSPVPSGDQWQQGNNASKHLRLCDVMFDQYDMSA